MRFRPMAWMLLTKGRRGNTSNGSPEMAVLYTHYDYLELPPGASSARVETAYRMLKKRLNAEADEAMIRLIHEAYAVLSDPKRRTCYDETLRRAADEADAELKACLDEKGAKVTRYMPDLPPLPASLTAWAA